MDGLELLHSFGDHKSSKPGEMYTDELYEKNLQGYVGEFSLRSFTWFVSGIIFLFFMMNQSVVGILFVAESSALFLCSMIVF